MIDGHLQYTAFLVPLPQFVVWLAARVVTLVSWEGAEVVVEETCEDPYDRGGLEDPKYS